MGDPRKTRKQYTTPAHMWQGTRIEDEYKLKKEYGLKNNTEIWRANTVVSNARQQARNLIGKKDERGEAQKKLLLGRLTRLGIISKESSVADILAITVQDVLNRRLQTLLKEKGIAKSTKEARQMIIHGQVKFQGRKHTAPSTIVPVEKESTIAYTGASRTIRPPKKKEEAASPSIEADATESADKAEGSGQKAVGEKKEETESPSPKVPESPKKEGDAQ
ncbi:MAG: 30S ribosomal protein S4 [Candidatus Undinarchaeales archaeon]|jgi:small subunit ribosomal protein S4|nr:30S ribosomal protein S4 [Candidatus Undinarchaeales archaeon]